ncbi:hypothetical protein NPIL_333111 [Nephila pilipes]|uniref:Uncharacterized protein n=1 Tax=Nephila pilipes TaxID=299642 RepID=A0A8X6NIM3_NEPPI|nr:hypothetical protein NPIL_333111 [Nephila pilipes]
MEVLSGPQYCPPYFLGFRATWKKDLQATTVEIIYGAPIRLLGEFYAHVNKKHRKEVSVSVDQLKPAYVPKELVDITAGVHRKEKVSSQPDEILYTGQENSTGSSKRQESSIRSSRRVRFNPKYSYKSCCRWWGLPVAIMVCCRRERIQERESKQSTGPMNEEKMKHGLREEENVRAI